MKVNVVIVSCNQVALLQECISSLRLAAAQSDIAVDVAIIDNASGPQASVQICEISLPARWTLIQVEQNVGYAAALNIGYETLAVAPSDYTVLMNDDCIVPQKFFSALIDHAFQTNRPAIIGFPIEESTKGQLQVMYGMRYWPQIGLATPIQKGENATYEQRFGKPLVYPCGATIACRSDFLSVIGGVPTQNFLYFEELNLLLAAHSIGEETTLCDSIQIEHIGGASTSQLPQVRSKHYYSTLAALRFTLARYPIWLPTVLLARAMAALLRMLKSRSVTPARSLALAIKDFLRGPKGQKLRDQDQ